MTTTSSKPSEEDENGSDFKKVGVLFFFLIKSNVALSPKQQSLSLNSPFWRKGMEYANLPKMQSMVLLDRFNSLLHKMSTIGKNGRM